jgi:Lectin C-type domain
MSVVSYASCLVLAAGAVACGHHDTAVATYHAPIGDELDAAAEAVGNAGPRCMQTYSTTEPGLMSRYKVVTAGQPWVVAERDCESEGGHLVVIDDEAENLLVKTVAEQSVTNNKSTHQLTWIGLGDSVSEGEFRWVTGAGVTLVHWFAGEPNSLYGNEDCVEVRATGEWNDDRCDAPLTYICECDGVPSAGEWCDTLADTTCGDCRTSCPTGQTCMDQRCM